MNKNISVFDPQFDVVIRQNIRNRLVELRVETGLTQSDVGKIVGKSKNAVASWEQGLSLPDVQTLYRLSLYYRKTLEFMFGLEEGEKK